MRQLCILEKLNFPGKHAAGPPSVLAPAALDPISAGPTMNCFRRYCSRFEIFGNSQLFKHIFTERGSFV